MLAAARRAKYKKRVFGAASLPDNLDNLDNLFSPLQLSSFFSFHVSIFLFNLRGQCQEKGVYLTKTSWIAPFAINHNYHHGTTVESQ